MSSVVNSPCCSKADGRPGCASSVGSSRGKVRPALSDVMMGVYVDTIALNARGFFQKSVVMEVKQYMGRKNVDGAVKSNLVTS